MLPCSSSSSSNNHTQNTNEVPDASASTTVPVATEDYYYIPDSFGGFIWVDEPNFDLYDDSWLKREDYVLPAEGADTSNKKRQRSPSRSSSPAPPPPPLTPGTQMQAADTSVVAQPIPKEESPEPTITNYIFELSYALDIQHPPFHGESSSANASLSQPSLKRQKRAHADETSQSNPTNTFVNTNTPLAPSMQTNSAPVEQHQSQQFENNTYMPNSTLYSPHNYAQGMQMEASMYQHPAWYQIQQPESSAHSTQVTAQTASAAPEAHQHQHQQDQQQQCQQHQPQQPQQQPHHLNPHHPQYPHHQQQQQQHMGGTYYRYRTPNTTSWTLAHPPASQQQFMDMGMGSSSGTFDPSLLSLRPVGMQMQMPTQPGVVVGGTAQTLSMPTQTMGHPAMPSPVSKASGPSDSLGQFPAMQQQQQTQGMSMPATMGFYALNQPAAMVPGSSASVNQFTGMQQQARQQRQQQNQSMSMPALGYHAMGPPAQKTSGPSTSMNQIAGMTQQQQQQNGVVGADIGGPVAMPPKRPTVHRAATASTGAVGPARVGGDGVSSAGIGQARVGNPQQQHAAYPIQPSTSAGPYEQQPRFGSLSSTPIPSASSMHHPQVMQQPLVAPPFLVPSSTPTSASTIPTYFPGEHYRPPRVARPAAPTTARRRRVPAPTSQAGSSTGKMNAPAAASAAAPAPGPPQPSAASMGYAGGFGGMGMGMGGGMDAGTAIGMGGGIGDGMGMGAGMGAGMNMQMGMNMGMGVSADPSAGWNSFPSPELPFSGSHSPAAAAGEGNSGAREQGKEKGAKGKGEGKDKPKRKRKDKGKDKAKEPPPPPRNPNDEIHCLLPTLEPRDPGQPCLLKFDTTMDLMSHVTGVGSAHKVGVNKADKLHTAVECEWWIYTPGGQNGEGRKCGAMIDYGGDLSRHIKEVHGGMKRPKGNSKEDKEREGGEEGEKKQLKRKRKANKKENKKENKEDGNSKGEGHS